VLLLPAAAAVHTRWDRTMASAVRHLMTQRELCRATSWVHRHFHRHYHPLPSLSLHPLLHPPHQNQLQQQPLFLLLLLLLVVVAVVVLGCPLVYQVNGCFAVAAVAQMQLVGAVEAQ
jgi:hypothetical protein